MSWWILILILIPIGIFVALWGLSCLPNVRRAIVEVERAAERGE